MTLPTVSTPLACPRCDTTGVGLRFLGDLAVGAVGPITVECQECGTRFPHPDPTFAREVAYGRERIDLDRSAPGGHRARALDAGRTALVNLSPVVEAGTDVPGHVTRAILDAAYPHHRRAVADDLEARGYPAVADVVRAVFEADR